MKVPPFLWQRAERFAKLCTLILCAEVVWAAGCSHQAQIRTSDPQLRPIQDMLDEQLPQGTPEANVLTYLNNHGYAVLPAGVTFYFDENHKLKTFELQRTFNEPIPQ